MIIEILSLAAALEWLALGVLVFFKLRSLKSRIDVLLDEMWPKSPATLRDETPIGPGPDRPEKRPVANLPGMLGCGLLPLGRKDRYVYVYGVRVHRRRDCQLNAWPEFPATL